MTLPGCATTKCSGSQIDDNLGLLRFCVPRAMRVQKVVGTHGGLHYSISFSQSGQRHMLSIVSGPHSSGRDPRAGDLRWTLRHWRCQDLKGEDYRLNDNGRHARYVTLNAPVGYATYEGVPREIADRFDVVLDSLCCGECKACKPKQGR